jgi:hypothetical protein
MDPDPASDPTPFFSDFKDAKKLIFFLIFFLITTHRQNYRYLILQALFQSAHIFLRKVKDPDPYLLLVDPDPGGPKHADPDPQH